MATFDYITAKEFRENLEADYAELTRCVEANAWKSVQVLAGSIVEALLVDYLAATTHPTRPNKDPLKLDLAEAITICRQEKVLSERTADLCSVVRSYRNLIHPGRVVRLEEPAPDANSSRIALGLIELINEDLTRVLRLRVGLTGEQIVSKIKRDANSLTILTHMLAEVNDHQKQRLLRELIVPDYMNLLAGEREDPFDQDTVDVKDRLKRAFRLVFDSATEATRQRVAAEFVRILREEDGQYVLDYGAAFFLGSDILYLPEQYRPIVIEHLLGLAPSGLHSEESLRRVARVEKFLTKDDVRKWFDPLVRTILSPTVKPAVRERARRYVLYAMALRTSEEVVKRISERLANVIVYYQEHSPEKADVLMQLRKEIEDQEIPF